MILDFKVCLLFYMTSSNLNFFWQTDTLRSFITPEYKYIFSSSKKTKKQTGSGKRDFLNYCFTNIYIYITYIYIFIFKWQEIKPKVANSQICGNNWLLRLFSEAQILKTIDCKALQNNFFIQKLWSSY